MSSLPGPTYHEYTRSQRQAIRAEEITLANLSTQIAAAEQRARQERALIRELREQATATRRRLAALRKGIVPLGMVAPR